MPLRRLTPNARVLLSLLTLLTLFIGIPLLLRAVVPGWWEEKHVYQYEGESVADASDFSAANQGQLKNMAVSAYEYLLGKIPAGLASSSDPGGLGPITHPDPNLPAGPNNQGSPGWRILNIIKQWIVVDDNESIGAATLRPLRQMFYPNGQPILNNGQPTYGVDGTGPRQIASSASTHKDFTAINLGQMKAVAAPFYDRLAAVYAPFPYPQPWATDGGTANDFATANLGQLKRVFSFDLDADSDGDGLTDLQELIWSRDHPNQPNARVLNPFVSNAVDTDNDGLTDAEEMFRLGTNPDVADTDGDGFNDGEDRYPKDNRQNDDIPPKNFAIVDLTTFLPANMKDTFNTNNVSMDESGQIAFYGYSGFDSKNHVYVWKNGAIDNAQSSEIPYGVNDLTWTTDGTTYRNVWRPAALGASGRLTGVIDHQQTTDGQVTRSQSTFSWKPGDSLPFGWDSGVNDTGILEANVSISPNGAHTIGYALGEWGGGVMVDGTTSTGKSGNPGVYRWEFYPAAITDSGRYLVSVFLNRNCQNYYVDGSDMLEVPFNFPVSAKGEWASSYGPSIPGTGFLERPANNVPTTSFAMNDNHQFVIRDPNGDAKFIQRTGGTWTNIPILDLLKWDGKPAGTKDDYDKYKNQLSGVTPKLISNVAPSTAGMVINGQTFTNGAPTQILFTAKSAKANASGSPLDVFGNLNWGDTQDFFLDLVIDDATSSPPQGHYILRQKKVPEGWSVTLTACNADGGAAGTGHSTTESGPEKPLLAGPIEIKEVISDQIADNEANKLPTAYYGWHPNNPMLMATRSEREARLAIKVQLPKNCTVPVRVGVRAQIDTSDPRDPYPSAAVVPAPAKTKLTFGAYSGVGLYQVVAGYDANNNGALDKKEAAVVFQQTPKLAKTKDGISVYKGDKWNMVDQIMVVTIDDFLISRRDTEGYGNDAFISALYPTASALVVAFAKGSNTINGATTENDVLLDASTIPSSDGLSHPLGGKWNAANKTTTHRFIFSEDSDLSGDVADSAALKEMYKRALDKHRTTIAAAAVTGIEKTVTISFTDDGFDFSQSDSKRQVHAALGKCKFEGSLEIKMQGKATGGFDVLSLNCYGSMMDLYDFAYGGAPITVNGRVFGSAKDGARTQAGYASLTSAPYPDAGRVFFTKVKFGTGWFEYKASY